MMFQCNNNTTYNNTLLIIYLFIVLLIDLLFCVGGTQDNTKFCSPNGIPSFVPSKYLYHFYDQNNYFYGGKIYTILPVHEKDNWENSKDICNSIGFDLLEIHTNDDVHAIQTIILSNFETNEIYHSDFWLGGNAQWSNTNGLQWMWNEKSTSNSREIKNFYWESGKEEQFMNYQNKCIKITRNSWYKQWKVTSCLESNRIICQKDINNEIEDTYSYIQCECINNYSGIFCNKTNVDFYTINKFTCNYDRLFLSCPENTLIYIDYAQFGIFDEGSEMCNDTNIEKDMFFNCTDPFSISTLKMACEGKQICDLQQVNTIYDYSICSKNSLSGLKYRMECIDKGLFNKCPIDFDLIDNKCIKIFLNTKKTWFESRKICNSMGSDLIEPTTTEVIRRYINSKTIPTTNTTLYFWQLGYLSNFLQNNNTCPKVTFNLNPTNELNINIHNCNDTINFICQKPPLTIFDEDRMIDGETIKDSLNKQTKVSYLEPSSLSSKCPSISWFSLNFNETDICTYSTAICGPNGQLAYLKCGCGKNEWDGLPDTKNCLHTFFNDIDKEILLNKDINYLSDYLYKNLKNYTINGELYAGDLIEGINTINKLINYNDKIIENNGTNDVNVFIENIAKSGDTLLSNDNRENWNLWMSGDVKGNISFLMTLLEQLVHSPNIKNEISMTEGELSNWEFLFIPDYKDNSITRNRALMSPVVETKFPYIQLPSVNDIEDNNQPIQYKRRFFNNNTKEISVAYYVYKNMYWLLKPNSTKLLNSHVIGTTVNSPNDNINFINNSTVKIILNHLRKNNFDNITCVYWDKKKLIWSGDGCFVLESNVNFTTCACSHLTNFAILIDVVGDDLSILNQGASDALELISIFGCALSILFLFVSILIFQCLPSIHSERVCIHRNLCIALLAAELTFIIGIHRTSSDGGCKTVAILLHYLFLSSFCWMLVEGCELYRLLIKVFEPDESHMNYYYLFCLIFPGIVVAFSAGFGWRHYGTSEYCWIDTKSGFIWTFVGPIILVIIINIVILFIALKVVLSVRSRDRKTGSKIMGWIRGSSTLLCLLGITWVFGFLSAIRNVEPIFTFIFTILNSLQGLFIFVFHILLNEKIQKALIKSSIRMSSIFRKSKISPSDNGTFSNNTIMTHNNKISQSKETSLSLWQKIKLSLDSNNDDEIEGTMCSINQMPSDTENSCKNSLNVSLKSINNHIN